MKGIIVVLFLITVGMHLGAVEAADFLIGAYSQYQIRYAGSNYEANFTDLGNFLHGAGYNATTYSLHNSSSIQMSHILQPMETANVKSILIDGTWLPNQNKVGVSSLSFGNNLKIEAEYQLKTDSIGNFVVDELNTANQEICMESYDYVTKHECGTFMDETELNIN
ncbi:MAG: hypothetical protein M0P99_08420, partial [Candidatus Cloacimonetes bacterium]|nr:hypothetical protein [Candidatus Cloacimonadota bacterium]